MCPASVVKSTSDRTTVPLKSTKKHHQHIYLEHPDESAMAEHCISLRPEIQIQDISMSKEAT
jgi:hypothetical protein